MTLRFEELDYRQTALGVLSLRRRHVPKLGVDVLEIMLGEEHLMSDLFTVSEIALARLALGALEGTTLDVVVGGLGLGFTAHAVLEDQHVASLLVVETLDAVIEWHQSGLVPLGPALTGDPRCRLVRGDFFALSASSAGFDADAPNRRFHAILVDIDHAPNLLLSPRHAGFYRLEGLHSLSTHLHPGGVFGLWSNERPDGAFVARLAEVFGDVRAEPVTFHNPLQDQPFTQTIYLARSLS